MNINIPGVSGFDVCRVLDSDPMLRHTPILLLTPYEQKDLDLKGVAHVLSKPINLGELMNLVQRYSPGVLVPRAER